MHHQKAYTSGINVWGLGDENTQGNFSRFQPDSRSGWSADGSLWSRITGEERN